MDYVSLLARAAGKNLMLSVEVGNDLGQCIDAVAFRSFETVRRNWDEIRCGIAKRGATTINLDENRSISAFLIIRTPSLRPLSLGLVRKIRG